ncbi:hypothetical protein PHPALM_20549 [Phytophthora palmivora]|uniref:Uncharacterized protein n=1 Tax=Phytophthora palmivora TaxID=4796 RepID=A0A2P4XEL3_9STRA|nr:hypothetical protein PHPALM_20549 [Phytophthora palmivora]
MGVCHSSCANTSSLEYYDAWGHQVRLLFADRTNPTASLIVVPKQTPNSGYVSVVAVPSAGNSTMLFQNYFKYVDMSPYVVLQDKTQQCDCVMCCGMTDVSPPQRRWKDSYMLKRNTTSLTDESLTDDEPERLESP